MMRITKEGLALLESVFSDGYYLGKHALSSTTKSLSPRRENSQEREKMLKDSYMKVPERIKK